MWTPDDKTIMAHLTRKCDPPHGAACTTSSCRDCKSCRISADLFEAISQLDVRRLRRTVEAARRADMDMTLLEWFYQLSRLAAAGEQSEKAKKFFAEVASERLSLAASGPA
jgi:hypothetical protein